MGSCGLAREILMKLLEIDLRQVGLEESNRMVLKHVAIGKNSVLGTYTNPKYATVQYSEVYFRLKGQMN